MSFSFEMGGEYYLQLIFVGTPYAQKVEARGNIFSVCL